VWANGDWYIGEWFKDTQHGMGREQMTLLQTTTQYEGGFSQGKRHGKGKETVVGGSTLKEGTWSEGIFKVVHKIAQKEM